MESSAANDRRALGIGLQAVALWSTVATAFKLSLEYTSALTLVTLATTVSWFFYAGVITRQRDWGAITALPRGVVGIGLLMGLVNPALYYLVLFMAYERLPAQEIMAINYTWAIVQPLLAAPLLKQRLGAGELTAALISYLGVFVIATRGQPLSFQISDALGLTLALATTVIWALFWIANTANQLDPVHRLFLNFSGAAPILIAVCAYQGGFDDLPWQGIAGGVYIGVFEMGLSFLIWLTALRLSSSTVKLSTLVFLSPPVSLVFIWLVLDEPILMATIVGLALILLGLSLQHWRRS
jgi:drug/metabolite transporter (DMT)-like permease